MSKIVIRPNCDDCDTCVVDRDVVTLQFTELAINFRVYLCRDCYSNSFNQDDDYDYVCGHRSCQKLSSTVYKIIVNIWKSQLPTTYFLCADCSDPLIVASELRVQRLPGPPPQRQCAVRVPTIKFLRFIKELCI